MSAPGGEALKLSRCEGDFSPSWLLALTVGWTWTIWALWQLPLFFLLGPCQAGSGLGSAGFWLSVRGVIALSFLSAAVYFATGRSILAVVVVAVTVLVCRAPTVPDCIRGVGGVAPRTEGR